jgi:hypothetical protein
LGDPVLVLSKYFHLSATVRRSAEGKNDVSRIIALEAVSAIIHWN